MLWNSITPACSPNPKPNLHNWMVKHVNQSYKKPKMQNGHTIMLMHIHVVHIFSWTWKLVTLYMFSSHASGKSKAMWPVHINHPLWSVLLDHLSNLLQGHLLNATHPKISMHILHTFRYTFPVVLMRRICQTIKSFFS